jgi:hypothetical protein
VIEVLADAIAGWVSDDTYVLRTDATWLAERVTHELRWFGYTIVRDSDAARADERHSDGAQ